MPAKMPRSSGQLRSTMARPADPEATRVLDVLNEAASNMLAAVQGHRAAPPLTRFEELCQFIYQAAQSDRANLLVTNKLCAVAMMRILSALVRWPAPRTRAQRMTQSSAATVVLTLASAFSALLDCEGDVAERICPAVVRTDALQCLSRQLQQATAIVVDRLRLLSPGASKTASDNGAGMGAGMGAGAASGAAAAAAATAAQPETVDAVQTSYRWAMAALYLGSFLLISATSHREQLCPTLEALTCSGVAERVAAAVLQRGLLCERLEHLGVGGEAARASSGHEDWVNVQRKLVYLFALFCKDGFNALRGVVGSGDDCTPLPWLHTVLGPCSQYLVLQQGLCTLHQADGLGLYGLPEGVSRALPLASLAAATRATGAGSGSGSGGGGGDLPGGPGRPLEALLSVLYHLASGQQERRQEQDQQDKQQQQQQAGHACGLGITVLQLSPRAVLHVAARVLRLAVRSGRAWVSVEEQSRAAAARGSAGVAQKGQGQQGAAEGAGAGRSGDGPVLMEHDVARVALQGLAVYGRGVRALEGSAGRGGGGAGGSWRGVGGKGGPQVTGHVAREGEDAREAAREGEGAREAGGVALQQGRAWRQRQEEMSLGCELLSYCMRGASWEQRECMLGWVRARVATRVEGYGTGPLPASPPAPLRAALCGGILPALERLLRRMGRSRGHSESRLVGQLLLIDNYGGPGTTGLSWLLAYGDPLHAASFVASCGKVLRALGRDAVPAEEAAVHAADRGQLGSGDGRGGSNSSVGGGDTRTTSSAQAGSDALMCTLATAWQHTFEGWWSSLPGSVEAWRQIELWFTSVEGTAGGGVPAASSTDTAACAAAASASSHPGAGSNGAAAGTGGEASGPCASPSPPPRAATSSGSAAAAHNAAAAATDVPTSQAAGTPSAPAKQLQLMVSYALAELLSSMVPLALLACGRLTAAARAWRPGGCHGTDRRPQQQAGEAAGQQQGPQLSSMSSPLHSPCTIVSGNSLCLSMALRVVWDLVAAHYASAAGSRGSLSTAGGSVCGDGGGSSGEMLTAAAAAAAGWRQVLLPAGRPGIVQLLGALLPALPHVCRSAKAVGAVLLPAVGVCRVLLQVCPEEVRRLAVGAEGAAQQGAMGPGGAGECGGGWRPEHFITAAAMARAAGHGGCAEVALRLAEVVAPWWAVGQEDGGGQEETETEGRARQAAAALGPVPCGCSLLLPTPAEARAALPLPARSCAHAACAGLWGDSEAGLLGGLRACGGCGAAWYCSRECQAADWRAGHREACGGLQRREQGQQ